jgi:CubicO group peptidase (beta-lactamase class C family)
MRIGSTSKQFAALAALLLAEEGRLDLDAPARKVLPELPREVGEPTLRHFMTHTSGMRDYLDLGLLTNGLALAPKGTAFATQTRHKAANGKVGEKATYNNGGYHLLSIAIDRAAGIPMEQFVQERIFDPLGMSDTAWAPNDVDVQRGMATLHLPDGRGGWRKGTFPSEEVRAEGGMISTVDDMLKWVAHLRADKKIVGQPSSWAQMTKPARLASGLVVPYGLGLMFGSYRGLRIVHHGGTVFGGACQMLTVPERELDIVVLTNGALVHPGDLAEKVIDAVLADENLEAPAAAAVSQPFAALAGTTYGSRATGTVVTFVESEGRMAAALLNNPPVPLMNDDGDLRLPFEKVVAGPFVFRTAQIKRLAEQAPDTLVMAEGGQPEELAKLDNPPSRADAARDLAGRYLIADLDTPAEMRFEGESLELHVAGRFGQTRLVLTPVASDLFVWESGNPLLPLRGTLRVEREGGAVSAILVDTLRTRGLRAVTASRTGC